MSNTIYTHKKLTTFYIFVDVVILHGFSSLISFFYLLLTIYHISKYQFFCIYRLSGNNLMNKRRIKNILSVRWASDHVRLSLEFSWFSYFYKSIYKWHLKPNGTLFLCHNLLFAYKKNFNFITVSCWICSLAGLEIRLGQKPYQNVDLMFL